MGQKKGYKHTKKSKKKISENNACYWQGKKFSKEHKKKLSKTLKGKESWMKGRTHTKATRKKISISSQGIHCKEKHWNWQGGKSFEPYGLEFNENLKEVIRNRDRRKCQICEKTELESKEKLAVHHIDYNKKNCNPNNLITLCRSCHTKTNFNRKKWIEYFINS